jgi:hypothetical protein
MPVIRTQFREISAVRNIIENGKAKSASRGSNIAVIDIKEMPSSKKTDKSTLMFTYEYSVSYPLEPSGKLGEIRIIGEIFYVEDTKKIKTILDEWKKDKQINEDTLTLIINVGLLESTVEAIGQAHKVGVPSPIPLPRLKPAGKKSTSSAG